MSLETIGVNVNRLNLIPRQLNLILGNVDLTLNLDLVLSPLIEPGFSVRFVPCSRFWVWDSEFDSEAEFDCDSDSGF